MPIISSPNLTLTTSGDQTTVRVRYDVTFNPFERSLAELGKTWHSHISLHGIDGPTIGSEMGAVNFPNLRFTVTAGTTDQVFSRDEEETVLRNDLQEDPGPGSDELKAQIRIHSPEVLDEFTPFSVSNQEVLLG